MKIKMSLPTLTCERCGHIWYPRRENLPKVCPSCKSKKWQEAKVYLCPECSKDSYRWVSKELLEFHRDINHRGIMHGHAKD